jgi:TPR repeat protein
MNRLNPQPPATRRVAPAPAPAVVPAQRFAITNAAVNSEKAKIEKEELLKRTVAFEKEQAAAGSPTFQYELGVRYLTGDGVEPDLTEAKNWLTKAAKNGNKDAVAKLEELKKLETEKPDPNKKDAAK